MKRTLIRSLALMACLAGGLQGIQTVYAEDRASNDAVVNIEKNKTGISGIQDPENPENIVDPGDSPKTTGDLRIDFVPQLNFSSAKVTEKEMILPVNAQLFHSETTPRGNFIQVTDERDAATGWTLQVRQDRQFTHNEKEGVQLKGAVISFDKAWTNSTIDGKYSPTVRKEVIQMLGVGETYDLARAEASKGMGVWSIAFGASAENAVGHSNTLTQREDQDGKPMIDELYNQPTYANSAVNLSIPADIEKEAGAYSTVLTWTIAELP